MNKRRLFIILLVAVFILAAVTIIAVLTKPAANNTTQPNIRGGKLLINTASGPVVANNIYTQALANYPDNAVEFVHTTFYDMSYYPADDGFLITLLDSNVKLASQLAEQDFLKQLNITQTQACQLRVTMAVPYSVNPAYAGKILGLSYCQ